jgi:hypothetical protein
MIAVAPLIYNKYLKKLRGLLVFLVVLKLDTSHNLIWIYLIFLEIKNGVSIGKRT